MKPLMKSVCCLAMFLALGLLARQTCAVSPAVYDQALGTVQAALTGQAQAIRAGQIPSQDAPVLIAQRDLSPIRSVELPDALPQPVNDAPLIAAINAADALHSPDDKAASFEALSRQIGALRGALAHEGTRQPGAIPVKAVETAKAVLSGDEFASDPPPPPSMADRAAAWMDRMLAKLFSRPATNPNLPALPIISTLLLQGIFYFLAAAALAALVYVLVQILGGRGARARSLGLAEEEAVLVEARDNDSLLALAEQQAKAGDYRRAFRLVYLAALVALDTGGVLRFDRSKTNWEYLRALRGAGRGDISQALTPMTREFDQVWYGFSSADSSQYAHARSQYDALLASSPASSGVSQNVRRS